MSGEAHPHPSAAGTLAADSRQSSPAAKACLAALRIYKVYLSAHMPGGCRFDPTCSVYAYQAIERFGVFRGSWLALRRLLRCHPLSRRFGFDPVPERTALPGWKRAENPAENPPAAAAREAHS